MTAHTTADANDLSTKRLFPSPYDDDDAACCCSNRRMMPGCGDVIRWKHSREATGEIVHNIIRRAGVCRLIRHVLYRPSVRRLRAVLTWRLAYQQLYSCHASSQSQQPAWLPGSGIGRRYGRREGMKTRRTLRLCCKM